MRVGYPTRNLTLEKNTNHTLRLKNLSDTDRVEALVTRNLDDLESLIRWNAERGLELFRIGQSLIPFASHPAFPYDWVRVHGPRLSACGALARDFGARLSMHPGQFVVPASPTVEVRMRSLSELRYTARVLDLLGADDGVIVLHVGGVYGDREATRERMVRALSGEERVLRYLALENDERLWNVQETTDVAREVGVPVIVDTLHHELNSGDISLSKALSLSRETWRHNRNRPDGSRQKVHISSQARKRRRGAHSEYIAPENLLTLLDAAANPTELDLMVEAKGSEKAALTVLDALLA